VRPESSGPADEIEKVEPMSRSLMPAGRLDELLRAFAPPMVQLPSGLPPTVSPLTQIERLRRFKNSRDEA